ncbi:AsmA family protein [Noviherbaspirillum sp. UKPF54]|uniref:AsmA family protein n=1 Tax=Noviherbaspirillum sp. UKPF54 TaxID=2601898 RepID=UPI0011B13DE8|nr:AsmA family protein [Noviherbaspirillum sp. UKPF54]QDZ29456.1 AsmA family protein [Noviherbaspirillum sp. UKPF54]
MPKLVKYLLIALAALIGLLLAAAGFIAATFDPNDYKPLLIRLVQEKKQRTLSIPGEIKLSFFPRLGADLGKLSISEHNSRDEFASVDSAKVSLALVPLLRKQLVVDRVKIDGLRAQIRRREDGSANYDDLLSKNEESGQQVAFDIDGVDIRHAHLLYDDQKEGRTLELSDLNLETGKIASGVPSKLKLTSSIKSGKPALDARLALDTGFTMDLEQGRYVFKGLDGKLTGAVLDFRDLVLTLAGNADLKPTGKRFALDDIKFSAAGKRAGEPLEVKLDLPQLAITDTRVSGGKLSGTASLTQAGSAISASFGAPSFEGSPQAFKLPALTVDAALKDARRDVKAKISGAIAGDIDKLLFTSPQLALALSGRQEGSAIDGTLTTPLSANLGAGMIDLSSLLADFTLPNPGGGTFKLKAGGSAHVNLGKETVSAALKGHLDESAFDAKLGLTKFSPAAYTFDIGVDRIDLDRYQAKPAATAAAAPKPNAPEKPIDLTALRDLRADGSVRVGALKVKNIRTSNVRFDLHAAGGKLDISPLAANLYGGSVAGALSATASTPARFAVRQSLTGVNVGPLLKDAINKDTLEGKGNVQLDVTTAGGTFSQMMKGLNGTARMELRDGAVRGVNIAQAVRSAKAKIGEIRGDTGSGQPSAQSGQGSAAEKTDFSELSGSFRIANGVAHNDDLSIKSPLMRIGGAGDIDLGAERLDYLVRATVVQSLQGQGGPELQALRGVTVPVRLSGPFAALGWRIDFAGMASELAKQRIDEKKEEVKSKAQKALEEEKAKVQDQLKDQLKGLFGR